MTTRLLKPLIALTLSLVLVGVLAATHAGLFNTHPERSGTPEATAVAQTDPTEAPMPLIFEPNLGQTDDQVQFLARGSGYTLFLTGERAVLSLVGPDETGTALYLNLVGANAEAPAEGLDRLPGTSNYFIGNDPAKWQTHIAQYRKVRYSDVWPGIDVVYYGKQGQLEYDFVVAPSTNPAAIRLGFDGALSVSLKDDQLVLETVGGEVVQRAPVLYQETADGREAVEGRYVLLADNQVGFEVGAYDPDRELVIDPVLFYSTYLGGSGVEDLGRNRLGIDGAGNVYVAGLTPSTDFPTTAGAFATTHSGGGRDLYVTKLNPTGSALIYSTYVGGSDSEELFVSLVVDSDGSAYVSTRTRSADYPSTVGAYDTVLSGILDGAVTKLDPAGTALVYSTYLGGSLHDSITDIEVDAAGRAYVVGVTASTDFPVTAGALQPVFGGGAFTFGGDGFLTRVNATGTAFDFSTYFGGSGRDALSAVEIDAGGRIYAAGTTRSVDFSTVSPFQGNVINLRKKGCVQASATRENVCTKPDTASMQEGRFGSPTLKLMTLPSRGRSRARKTAR